MKVRSIDVNGDWNFGKGRNDYLSQNAAIAQKIVTTLRSFLGDCFFNTGAGIDWWNLLGGKSKIAIELSVKTAILNVEGVSGINDMSVSLDANRAAQLSYNVTTVYQGGITQQVDLLAAPTP
jgi:hypothetical protein